MSTFLSHAQTTDLKRRTTRALAPGKTGTHGQTSAGLTAAESRTFEVIMDCLNDMHREGLLVPGYRPDTIKEATQS